MTIGSQIAWDDTVLPFQLDASGIRGRVARLDGVLDQFEAFCTVLMSVLEVIASNVQVQDGAGVVIKG